VNEGIVKKMTELSPNDIETLRQRGKLLEAETGIREGDIVVAVNITSGTRRVIGSLSELHIDASRKLLLG
jgi:hypothetical protein